ncbi:MAG: ORF6N domain-containing protein [Candidatus Sabulitectum sp.]|nr:ORF6N domain-containing protein [Candidatus Sabulitectum sp.]
MENKNLTAPTHSIQDSIFAIRSVQVMLDSDLALMYDVETRISNQTVKRKIKRFPKEFMFQLTVEKLEEWKSQIVISNKEVTGIRKIPLVFTEQEVSMPTRILRSDIPFFPLGKIGSSNGNTVYTNEHECMYAIFEEAKIVCKNEGRQSENHFEEVLKMVTVGSPARRQVKSNTLTGYACHAIMGVVDFMVSQNAIPFRKYFAFFRMNIETFDLRSQVVTSRG